MLKLKSFVVLVTSTVVQKLIATNMFAFVINSVMQNIKH